MALTLTAIATAVAAAQTIATGTEAVAEGVSSAITVAKKIYNFAAEMISTVEEAYSAQTSAGATKQAAVLAAVQALVEGLGLDWSTYEASITAFIKTTIAAYNGITNIVDAVESIGSSSSDSSDTTDAA